MVKEQEKGDWCDSRGHLMYLRTRDILTLKEIAAKSYRRTTDSLPVSWDICNYGLLK